jgi:hypothetical protein
VTGEKGRNSSGDSEQFKKCNFIEKYCYRSSPFFGRFAVAERTSVKNLTPLIWHVTQVIHCAQNGAA